MVYKNLNDERENLYSLLDLIIKHALDPNLDINKPFSMLTTLLDSDPYLGRCLIGKVESGSIKINDTVKSINLDGNVVENGRLTKLFVLKVIKELPSKKLKLET